MVHVISKRLKFDLDLCGFGTDVSGALKGPRVKIH